MHDTEATPQSQPNGGSQWLARQGCASPHLPAAGLTASGLPRPRREHFITEWATQHGEPPV